MYSFRRRNCSAKCDEGVQPQTAEVFNLGAIFTKSHLDRIDSIRNDYDEVIFPPLETVPLKFAIRERNKWMIRECDYVIAYVTHGWGGAAQTLRYAYVKEKTIFRIASDYDVT